MEKEHKEQIKKESKMYYQAIKEHRKDFYNKNRASILKRRKELRVQNKDKTSLRNKKYYMKNKGKSNYYKAQRIGSNILRAIKSGVSGKSIKAEYFLGCSISDARKHLELLFKENMRWENHGLKGWHIDHIKPRSSFDMSKEGDKLKCFHYTNMQPLWAEENREKGNKFGIKPELDNWNNEKTCKDHYKGDL